MTKNNLSSSLPGLLLGCTSQFSHCCSSHSCWISLTRSLGAHWKCGVQVDSGNEWWRWGDVNKLHRSYCMQCATTVSMVTLFVHKSSDRGSVLRQCSPAHHTFSCTDHWLFKIAATVSMVKLFVHKSSDRGSVLRQCSPAHHTFSCTDHWLFKIATTVSMVILFVHKSSDRGSVLRRCSPAHHTFSCTDHWLFKIATPGACSYWRNIPWSCQETKSEQSTKVHRNGSSEAEGRKWVTRHWSTGGLPNTL